MRWLLILAAGAAIGGCQKAPDAPTPVAQRAAPPEAAQTGHETSDYTLARICPNGTWIYGPPPYAAFAENQWFVLDAATALRDVC